MREGPTENCLGELGSVYKYYYYYYYYYFYLVITAPGSHEIARCMHIISSFHALDWYSHKVLIHERKLLLLSFL